MEQWQFMKFHGAIARLLIGCAYCLAFASPLMVVVACWRSTDPVEPAPSIPADARPVAAVPIDAEPPPEAPTPGITHRRPRATNPATPLPLPATALPPGTVVARVIGVNVSGSELFITVGAGTDGGVVRGSSCQLIGANSRPAVDKVCTIVRFDRRVTVLKTTLNPDQIRAHSSALLIPPP